MKSCLTMDISYNFFTGRIQWSLLPPSLVTLNVASNRFSSGLSFSNISSNLVQLNMSGIGFQNALITLSNLTLGHDARGSNTLILDITSNDFICPFPGVGDITAVNPGTSLVIFKDSCRTDFSNYVVPAIVVLVVAVLLVSIVGIVKPLRDKISSLFSRMTVVIFITFHFTSSQVGRIIDIISYSAMYKVVTTKSPDNCLPVNNGAIYRPVLSGWSNGGVNNTDFPYWSCEDPTLGMEPYCNMVPNYISNFTVYISYVLHGWPNMFEPAEVQSQIATFQILCSGFVRVNNIEECAYNPDVYACERVSDGSLPLNTQFLSFIYISIALVAVSAS